MEPQPDRGLGLDSASVAAINSALDGSDLASCVVDSSSRLGLVTLNVFSVLPPDGRIEEEYPLLLAVYPVQRVAASYVHNGSVRPIDLSEINYILERFTNKTIENWDIIDPPEQARFRWRDKLSFDYCWQDHENHVLEMWQDDNPFDHFNIAIWFERLYLFDRHLTPVSFDMIENWRTRLRDAMNASVPPGKGWSRAIPAHAPEVEVGAILDLIRT